MLMGLVFLDQTQRKVKHLNVPFIYNSEKPFTQSVLYMFLPSNAHLNKYFLDRGDAFSPQCPRRPALTGFVQSHDCYIT